MNSKIIKAFIGLIAAFILVIAVFGILPQLGMKGPFENFQNPLAGLFEGGGLGLLGEQALANGVTIVYSFVVTLLIALAIKATIGIRVDEETEVNGLDLAEHAETAYHGTN